MTDRGDLAWSVEMPLRTAVVVYDTTYGKTRLVAERLAEGFRREGVATDVLSVTEARQRAIDGYDLLALGAPAHHLSPSEAMRSFLRSLERMPKLREHYGYAFETRLAHHPGGAGRWIEGELTRLHLRLPRPHDAAVVVPPHGAGAPGTPDDGEYRLEAGAEGRFEEIGAFLVRKIRGELGDQFQ